MRCVFEVKVMLIISVRRKRRGKYLEMPVKPAVSEVVAASESGCGQDDAPA
jgi:hypothetical protein